MIRKSPKIQSDDKFMSYGVSILRTEGMSIDQVAARTLPKYLLSSRRLNLPPIYLILISVGMF